MRVRSRMSAVASLLLVVLIATTALAGAPRTRRPPPTRTDDVKEVLHGVEIVDHYRWLEDKSSPETRAWLDSQIAHTNSMLGALPGRDRLRARVEQLLKVDTRSVPFERGGRYFFTKRLASQDLPVLAMRRGLDGPDEVLVDPHPLSPDHTVSVSFLDISNDGGLIAYGTRQGGEDETTVKLLDLGTMQELPDRLPRARYFNISLLPDRSGLYYSRFGQEGTRVYYHRMGADPAGDTLLFGEGFGPDKIISASLSEDGRWLLVVVHHGSATDQSEVYVQDVAGHGPITPIVNDVKAYFSPDIADDHLYMQTNWNASNSRILDVDLRNPARDRWKEIIPERKDAVLEGFSLVGGKIFVNYLKNVVSSVQVFDPAGRPDRTIAFPTLGTVGGIRGRWASGEAFFSFSSFVVPPTIYRYDAASGAQKEWWRASVPISSDRFEVEQVWYASKDGTRIPMFVVHAKDMKLDGRNPTLLAGYGGFTISQTPSYSARAALWVEHGGVFAVPNLRGGGEFGEAWHRAGMLDRKQNVFDDFIAAAQWLVKSRYTKPERLSILGGSNGGLLVGAALTQRPDLFRAVVCSVPLLDMLRYHRFLVARFWVPEYGSSEDSTQFRTLYAYSPYHHVKPGAKYPAVLFVTGDSDTRVDPLHARKMAALLQASSGSDRPILLHYDTKQGHAGGKPVGKQIDDTTDELMFLFWQLGVSAGPTAAVPAAN